MRIASCAIAAHMAFAATSCVADAPTFSNFQLRNWGLQNSVSNSHIHAVDAWRFGTGSMGVVVAVIDTGIDADHPDLKSNILRNKDGTYGWDFVNNKPNPIDIHGHGTHVAGIIAAAPNAKSGTSGVAPGVSILPVKFYSDTNSGAKNLENSIKALNWALDHGAKIINYSGGGPEFSADEYSALKRARDMNVLVVAAAGNERQDTDRVENYYYPCAYRLENIVCVGNINIRVELTASSNWGKNRVDVFAPGENILSTAPGNRYSFLTGTSQATAFVTGIAALMLSRKPSLKPNEIREILRKTVDKFNSLKNKSISGGKVNAYSALKGLR